MTSHAPSIQPAARPHHVNDGLVRLLSGTVVIGVALAVLLSGVLIPTSTPTTRSGVDEALIAHRASERESEYPALPRIPMLVARANIYYPAAAALSGVHGPVTLVVPSVYYPAAGALSGVQVDNER